MGNPSRKYIDLIYASSSKWANWDPPNEIKVGDYGEINKKTGQFEREGNIYDDPLTAALAAKHPPVLTPPDDTFIISSRGARRHELKFEPGIDVAGLAEASIKGQWEFGKERGALLIMDRPQGQRIPPDAFLKQLADTPSLKDKVLVTEVYSCPAYSLYLSGSHNDCISIALVAKVPGVAPFASVGGEVGVSWWSKYSSGLFREACDKAGRYCYTPLYTLKELKKPSLFRRRESPKPEDKIPWVDTTTPWDPLDNDGEEEEFEDTVFD